MRISDWSSDVCSSDLRPASRLDALEHKIQSEQVNPETGEVPEEGRTEEDTGEGPDLATAIADIDAAAIVVGVTSRLDVYAANFPGDDLDELSNAYRKRVVEGKDGVERVEYGERR